MRILYLAIRSTNENLVHAGNPVKKNCFAEADLLLLALLLFAFFLLFFFFLILVFCHGLLLVLVLIFI